MKFTLNKNIYHCARKILVTQGSNIKWYTSYRLIKNWEETLKRQTDRHLQERCRRNKLDFCSHSLCWLHARKLVCCANAFVNTLRSWDTIMRYTLCKYKVTPLRHKTEELLRWGAGILQDCSSEQASQHELHSATCRPGASTCFLNAYRGEYWVGVREVIVPPQVCSNPDLVWHSHSNTRKPQNGREKHHKNCTCNKNIPAVAAGS